MKIILVIDSFGSGGSQRQMVNLAQAMITRGHDIDFFIYYPEFDHFLQIVQKYNITIHKCDKRYNANLKIVGALRRHIKE